MPGHRNIFNETQKKQLVERIRLAEGGTRGEIRVHIEDFCKAHPMERAEEVFRKLNMNDTLERTGVLIYLAVKDRKFAILGDQGIDQLVPENFWEDIKNRTISHCREGRFFEGIHEAIGEVGEKLHEYFPAREGDNPNELSNEISYES